MLYVLLTVYSCSEQLPWFSGWILPVQVGFQSVQDGLYMSRRISTCSMCSTQCLAVQDSFQIVLDILYGLMMESGILYCVETRKYNN